MKKEKWQLSVGRKNARSEIWGEAILQHGECLRIKVIACIRVEMSICGATPLNAKPNQWRIARAGTATGPGSVAQALKLRYLWVLLSTTETYSQPKFVDMLILFQVGWHWTIL